MMTTAANALDTSSIPTLTGFVIVQNTPDGTNTRFVIKTADNGAKWQKYNTSTKTWADVATQSLTAASVMAEGNTAEELNAVPATSMTGFTNKTVHVAAAIQTTNDTQPTIQSFSIKGAALKKAGRTVVMNADAPVQILGIDVDKKEVGGGKCTLIASIQDAAGVWSIYREYHEYLKTATLAKAIKFRAIYSVQNVGPDSVTLNSISVTYRSSKKGATNSVCMTKAFTFPRKISSVHMILKHPEALDMKFQPKVAFKNAVTDVETWIPMAQDGISEDEKTGLLVDEFDYAASSDEAGTIVTLRVDMKGNTGSVKDQTLGLGTGAVTTYHLPHSALSNTITVSPADAVWNYKSKDRSVDITAKAGSAVTISYDWEAEATYLDSMSCIFNE